MLDCRVLPGVLRFLAGVLGVFAGVFGGLPTDFGGRPNFFGGGLKSFSTSTFSWLCTQTKKPFPESNTTQSVG